MVPHTFLNRCSHGRHRFQCARPPPRPSPDVTKFASRTEVRIQQDQERIWQKVTVKASVGAPGTSWIPMASAAVSHIDNVQRDRPDLQAVPRDLDVLWTARASDVERAALAGRIFGRRTSPGTSRLMMMTKKFEPKMRLTYPFYIPFIVSLHFTFMFLLARSQTADRKE